MHPVLGQTHEGHVRPAGRAWHLGCPRVFPQLTKSMQTEQNAAPGDVSEVPRGPGME